jgi:hypothetical protein
VEALDGGVLDRAVHPLDLTIRPRVSDLGEAVLDAVLLAPHGEHVGHVPSCRSIGIARRKAKLDAIVGQDGAVATRYEKTARSFLGVLHFAAALDWLRR